MSSIDRRKTQEQKKEKLDKELLTKVMAMAIDSVNEEKVFEIDDFRIRAKLSDDNFVVRVGVVTEGSFAGDSLNIGKYVISRDGTIKNVYSEQGSLQDVPGDKYKEAVSGLKGLLDKYIVRP